MRKVLVALMAMSLLPALASAAVTSPEGFEGYALTTNWTPTEAGEGWVLGDLFAPFYPFDWKGEIKTSLVPGNTSQVLATVPREVLPYENEGGLVATWYKSLPDSAAPITKTSWDFAPTGNVLGNQWLMHVTRLNDNSLPPAWRGADEGNQSWQVGGVWGWFGDHDPDHGGMAYLQTLTAEGTWTEEPILGPNGDWGTDFWQNFDADGGVPPPDKQLGDTWYTVEVEEDNVLSKTRARIYETASPPAAEAGWTSWLDHHPTLHGLDYETGGKVIVRSQGYVSYDNFSMTQDSVCNAGDANNDLLVSADDYASVQGAFGNTGDVGILGDANCDGLVSADDYASVQSNFGTTYGGAPVPEPATMLLLGAGSLLLIRRKRR